MLLCCCQCFHAVLAVLVTLLLLADCVSTGLGCLILLLRTLSLQFDTSVSQASKMHQVWQSVVEYGDS